MSDGDMVLWCSETWLYFVLKSFDFNRWAKYFSNKPYSQSKTQNIYKSVTFQIEKTI